MGPYCRYCDRRCFVPRVLPDGERLILATCEAGMAHDRAVCGYDHTTAHNPGVHGLNGEPFAALLLGEEEQ